MKYNSIILGLLFWCITNVANGQDQFPHVEGELLIQLKSGKTLEAVLKDLGEYEGMATKVVAKRHLSPQLNIWQVTFDDSIIEHNTILGLATEHAAVEGAQLNYITEKRVVPSDVNYGQQWQYEQVSDFDLDAEAAWDITTGGVTALGDTIVVCVIDDGVEVSHPDWKDNIWYNHNEIPNNGLDDDGNGYIDDYRGWNADANTNDILPPNPWNTHGTPVAGIVAAQGDNGIGVTGVNWDVKMMFVVGGGTNAAAIAAYDYPLACRRLYNQTNGALGAFVVATNASWGVDNQDCSTYAPLVNAIYDSLGTEGVLNAAATTNSNTNVDLQGDFPTTCTSDYIIGVTNMQQNGNKVPSAGYGDTHVDLGAYGQGSYTIATGQTYNTFGGTSAAAPHVAGAIGLLYSAPCTRFAVLARQQPAQTALLIKQILLNSTVAHPTLQGITASEGVLNLKNALDSVLNIGCSVAGCHEPYQPTSIMSTGTSAIVSWDSVDSTSQYYYQYRIVGTTTWTTGAVTDTFVLLNSLLQCSQYEIQVASDCDSTNYSESLRFETEDCCTAPSNITITQEGLTTASFSWDTVILANSYSVEYKRRDDTTWTSVGTSLDSLNLVGLDSCTVYELRLLSNCAVNINNSYSSTTILETDGCGSCSKGAYCTSAGTNTNDDWLERVTFGSINNTSGNDNGYKSFVQDNITTTVARGANYPIDIDLGFNTGFWATNWRLKVWIDYNQDEFFDPNTELVYDAGAINTAIRNHTGMITIPSAAQMGRTRMRVSMKWGNTDLAACDNPTYGEVEDYCILIAGLTDLTKVISTESTTLEVYPNPFDRNIYLDIHSAKRQDATIQIVNIAGQQLLRQQQNLIAGRQQMTLDLPKVAAGVYFLKMQMGETILIKKIVKQ